MKKIMLAAFAVLSISACAQVKFGIKAGYSFSSLLLRRQNTSYETSTQGQPSFYAGLMAEDKLNDKVAVQVEALYNPFKAKYTISTGSNYYESVPTFKSIMAPVQLKYYFTNEFTMGLGANFIFLTAIDSKEKTIINGITKETSEDLMDANKHFAITPFVSAEYGFKNGIFFDTKYMVSVNNIEANNDTNHGYIKPFIWQIGAGYKF